MPADCVKALSKGNHPEAFLLWAEEVLPLRMGARGRACRDLWDAIP